MIDLTQPIYYDIGSGGSLNINTITSRQDIAGGSNPFSGYMVDGIRVGEIEPVGYTDARSTSDGLDVAEAYAARRTIQLVLSVYGETRADLFDKMQKITDMMRFMPKRFASTNGFRQLRFTLRLATGAKECYFYARPKKMPKMDSTSGLSSGTSDLGYSAKINLEFLLKYPYKYAQSLSTNANVPYNGTVVSIVNNGAAPADATMKISSSSESASRTDDIKIVVTLNETPITLKQTKTIGLDGSVIRSILIDFKDQIVYEIEKNVSSGVETSSIAQNLIQIDSGATFGTVEPESDYPGGNPLIVEIRNATTDALISTGYTVVFNWREMWY